MFSGFGACGSFLVEPAGPVFWVRTDLTLHCDQSQNTLDHWSVQQEHGGRTCRMRPTLHKMGRCAPGLSFSSIFVPGLSFLPSIHLPGEVPSPPPHPSLPSLFPRLLFANSSPPASSLAGWYVIPFLISGGQPLDWLTFGVRPSVAHHGFLRPRYLQGGQA